MRYTTSILIFHVALFISLQFIHCHLHHKHVLPLDDDDQGGTTELIEKTCKRTPHYDLCVSSLESNPQSSTSDLRGLAHIMVDLVLSKATETLDYIRSLLKEEPDPELERSLAYCAELYIPVVKYSLPQAIEALIGGHFGFANYGVSDAAKQAKACDKNFSESNNSPLADKNSLLNDLSEVAAAIISILLKVTKSYGAGNIGLGLILDLSLLLVHMLLSGQEVPNSDWLSFLVASSSALLYF